MRYLLSLYARRAQGSPHRYDADTVGGGSANSSERMWGALILKGLGRRAIPVRAQAGEAFRMSTSRCRPGHPVRRCLHLTWRGTVAPVPRGSNAECLRALLRQILKVHGMTTNPSGIPYMFRTTIQMWPVRLPTSAQAFISMGALDLTWSTEALRNGFLRKGTKQHSHLTDAAETYEHQESGGKGCQAGGKRAAAPCRTRCRWSDHGELAGLVYGCPGLQKARHPMGIRRRSMRNRLMHAVRG